jgi:5-methyltetrahydrofolate--homocysteine methyltransferase
LAATGRSSESPDAAFAVVAKAAGWLSASGVVGLYPANSVGDDIEIYTDESRSQVAMTWHGLRQQTEKTAVEGVMRPSRCLADFVAPKLLAPEVIAARAGDIRAASKKDLRNQNQIADYIGLFAVTAGLGAEKKEKYFQDDHDDYSSIMLKSLADRLAEAFAEALHQRVRMDLAKRRGAKAGDLQRLLAPNL